MTALLSATARKGRGRELAADRILLPVGPQAGYDEGSGGGLPGGVKAWQADSQGDLPDNTGACVCHRRYGRKRRVSPMAAAQATYVIEHLTGKGHRMQLTVVPNGMFVVLPVADRISPILRLRGRFTEEDARQYNMKVKCGQAFMRVSTARPFWRERKWALFGLFLEAYGYPGWSADYVSACHRYDWRDGYSHLANGLTAYQLSTA